MRVVALISGASRSGKTMIASHLAVEAGLRGAGPVALIDLDPQAALTSWWNLRAPETPLLATTTLATLPTDLDRLRDAGVKLAIIDTPNAAIPVGEVVAASDLLLVPARPTSQGMLAAVTVVELFGGAGKPIVFVLNGVTGTTRISADSLAALSQHGPLAPAIIHENADFAAALAAGQTVVEIPALSPSRRQIEALWKFIDDRLAPPAVLPVAAAFDAAAAA